MGELTSGEQTRSLLYGRTLHAIDERVDVAESDYDSEVVDTLTELMLLLDKTDRLLVQSVKQHEGDSDEGLEWIAQLALEVCEARKRLHDIEDSLCAKIPRLARGAWEFTVGRVGVKIRGGTKYVRWDRSRLIPVVASRSYVKYAPETMAQNELDVAREYNRGVDAGIAALAKVIPQGESMQFGTKALRSMGIDPFQYATTEAGRKNVTLTRLSGDD